MGKNKLEDKFKYLSSVYEKKRIGILQKQHPGVCSDGYGGVIQTPGSCDFMGSINGLPVLIECKETIKKAFYLGNSKRAKRQREKLRQWHDIHNGLSYLCLLQLKTDRVYLLPFCQIPDKGNLFIEKFYVSQIKKFHLNEIVSRCNHDN